MYSFVQKYIWKNCKRLKCSIKMKKFPKLYKYPLNDSNESFRPYAMYFLLTIQLPGSKANKSS